MFTYNAVGPISAWLKAFIQRLREDILAYAALDKKADSAVIEGVVKTLDEADEIGEDLRLGEERVAVDKRLSAVGQQQEMVKVVTAIRARLAFVEKAAKDRRDAAAAERKTLEAIPKPTGDAVVAQLQEAEIRARLRSIPMAQRMHLYLAAQGDISIVRAIKNCPAGEVLIEPDFLKRVDHEWLERSKPEQLRRVEALEFASQKLSILANVIEGTLGGYGNTVNFPTPPIKQVNLGTKNTQGDSVRSA